MAAGRGVIATAAAAALGEEDTGDKAGLGVEQLEVVENRFVGGVLSIVVVVVVVVAVIEAGGVRWIIIELLGSAAVWPPLVLCDFECRISRFMRPEEKLHKWHLYICWGVELEPPKPPPALLPPTTGDRMVDEPRMRTSCSLVGRIGVLTLGDEEDEELARILVVPLTGELASCT